MGKIVLVNAVYFNAFDNFHIGQFILRDILKKEYDVSCINFDYLNKAGEITYTEELAQNITIMGDYILNLEPDIVGFYTICNAFIVAIKLGEYIKSKNRDISVFFGGPQATVTYKECLEAFSFLDAVCLGESEYTIEPFIDALLHGESLDDIKGIAYKDEGRNKVVVNACNQMIERKDLEKFIVYEYRPFEVNSEDFLSIEGGRGCPFACAFCTTSEFWGRSYRVKPTDVIVAEMKKDFEIYGVHKFGIQHDMFTADRNFMIEFCEKLIENKNMFEWTCSSRIDVLDFELIDIMKMANCTGIYMGIETGSPRMQKIINKNLVLDHSMEIIEYIKNTATIGMTLSFIYCFPDEQILDFRETIDFIEKLLMMGVTDVQLHRFMPLPGTPETKKVINRLYFDKSTVEATLNNIHFNEIESLILKYPGMFSQYYTFDSEVRTKYKRFDYLIEIITATSDFYFTSFRYLIMKDGLEGLYIKMSSVLEILYVELQERNIAERMKNEAYHLLKRIDKVLSPFLKREMVYKKEPLLVEIYRYESMKVTYFLNSGDKPIILRFSVNIDMAISDLMLSEEEYYIKYWKKGDRVITTHVLPSRRKTKIIMGGDKCTIQR